MELPPDTPTPGGLYGRVLEAHGLSVNAPRVESSGPPTHIGLIDSLYTVEDYSAVQEPIVVNNQARFVDTTLDDTRDHVENHGTAVFDIIRFFAGNVEYSFYQVIDENGGVGVEDFARALERAIEDGIDILNVSAGVFLSGCRGGCGFCHSVNRAIDEGIIVVAAAGNKLPDEEYEGVNCPARTERSIAVGGMTTICAYGTDSEVYPEGAYWAHNEANLNFEGYPQDDVYCGQRGCEPGKDCVVNQIDQPWQGNVDPSGGKPDVLAPCHTIRETGSGDPIIGTGSSYAAPVVSGNLANLLSEIRGKGIPDSSPESIRNAIIEGSAPMDRGDHRKLNVMRTQALLES